MVYPLERWIPSDISACSKHYGNTVYFKYATFLLQLTCPVNVVFRLQDRYIFKTVAFTILVLHAQDITSSKHKLHCHTVTYTMIG
jgi:hypothetical protein